MVTWAKKLSFLKSITTKSNMNTNKSQLNNNNFLTGLESLWAQTSLQSGFVAVLLWKTILSYLIKKWLQFNKNIELSNFGKKPEKFYL